MAILDLHFRVIPNDNEMYGASIWGRSYVIIAVKGGYSVVYQDMDSQRVWTLFGRLDPILELDDAMIACMRNLDQ